jgi:CheY-like chemotaxis protein
MYLPQTLDAVVEVSPVPPDRAGGRERVLVVEDNEQVRRAVVDMLGGWGYRVVAAENAEAAAGMLEKDPAFDLVLSDVVMPGGVTAVELGRLAQRLNPGVAVLLTSGFARDLLPRDEETFPMITKPFRAEDLAARVRSVLAAARRRSPAASPTRRVDAGTTPRRVVRPRRVLLVEDEVVLRMSTADMLERLDCFVAAVGSGEEALKLLADGGTFDLLLTDLGLPGISGEDLAAEVRRRHPRLRVVIASGYGPTDRQLEGVRFISKPYSSIDLQQALDQGERAESHS